jgi:3-oxoacyl-[acyl-carrier protein] reductase
VDLELEGQIVLVTGASRGIGRGIAQTFLQEGATVFITARETEALAATRDKFRDLYGAERVHAFAGDLQQREVLEDLHRVITDAWGRLNHLVCNIGTGRSVPPLAEDEKEWQRMLDINLLSATSCVRVMLPLLEKNASLSEGSTSIIFIASICGVEALGCPVAYAAAKNGLITYAKNIARPLGQRGIRVNTVSPGNVIFPGSTWEDKLAQSRDAVVEMLKREVPLQRLGTLEEIGGVVAFLASRRAAFVSGANWVVDGGQTRSM